MLINLEQLKNKYRIEVKGIAHIGAHVGSEVESYLKLFGEIPIHLFEPQKNIFKELKKNVVNQNKIFFYNIGLGSENKRVDFYVNTNNDGQSSSVLKPKNHMKYHPHVLFEKGEKIEIKRYDDLHLEKVNFMNIDVQGYELEVLKGASKNLMNIDYLLIEVNRKELYENCVLVNELDLFLRKFDLIRIKTEWWNKNGTWGDAFYIDKNLISIKNILIPIIMNKIQSIKGYFFIRSLLFQAKR